ncbi:MAG: selenocysteine-specific translation elongation factor [Kofleriaceae bacterium]
MTAHPIVLGTAGHIDHGKTSLVRALTGIDTDRLPVEKARGITTELGFARLALGDRTIAVVDVPGHERFVKSMVAGATGLDLVCLVIAADEGMMPQTREHLDICHLLGVRRGLVALTKCDLVDGEWLTMVTAEVRAALGGGFLASAPIVPVSTRTSEGLDRLRAELAALVDQVPPREPTGVFRLPIDRVFTVKGFGTVVTGTVLGGTVSVGDELSIIPGNRAVRVRGIESHGTAVPRVIAGHRAALNLGGIAVEELARGDLLVHPGQVAASHMIDVELRYLPSAPGPIEERAKVLVHHGTAQVLATLVLVGTRELPPGGQALAQLRIEATTPLGAVPGDRFILRGFVATSSHGSTIGGGRVIRVLAPKQRAGSQHAETVASLASARRDERIALDVKAAAFAGLSIGDLVQRLGAPSRELAGALGMLVASGELLVAGAGDHAHYHHATVIAELEDRIGSLVGAAGIAREELRTRLPGPLPVRTFDVIVGGLEARGKIVRDGDRVHRSAAPARPALSAIEQAVLTKLGSSGLEPPRPKELPAVLGLAEPQIRAVLDRLIAAKAAVKIKPDLIMHAEVVTNVRDKLLAFLATHETIDAQQWKELTGASRKFTIPLAEYFDAEKVTLRIGDKRRKR